MLVHCWNIKENVVVLQRPWKLPDIVFEFSDPSVPLQSGRRPAHFGGVGGGTIRVITESAWWEWKLAEDFKFCLFLKFSVRFLQNFGRKRKASQKFFPLFWNFRENYHFNEFFLGNFFIISVSSERFCPKNHSRRCDALTSHLPSKEFFPDLMFGPGPTLT